MLQKHISSIFHKGYEDFLNSLTTRILFYHKFNSNISFSMGNNCMIVKTFYRHTYYFAWYLQWWRYQFLPRIPSKRWQARTNGHIQYWGFRSDPWGRWSWPFAPEALGSKTVMLRSSIPTVLHPIDSLWSQMFLPQLLFFSFINLVNYCDVTVWDLHILNIFLVIY